MNSIKNNGRRESALQIPNELCNLVIDIVIFLLLYLHIIHLSKWGKVLIYHLTYLLYVQHLKERKKISE